MLSIRGFYIALTALLLDGLKILSRVYEVMRKEDAFRRTRWARSNAVASSKTGEFNIITSFACDDLLYEVNVVIRDSMPIGSTLLRHPKQRRRYKYQACGLLPAHILF